MVPDAELLRRYAEGGSEEAFSELVQRHIGLVYGAAVRRLGGNGAAAKDVCQTVFIGLAKRPPRLSEGDVLPAWLYRVTRNTVVDVVRAETRRRSREQAAVEVGEADQAMSSVDLEKLHPMLDDVMDELPEEDRAAVLLRFFLGRSYAEIGRELRLTDEAARKRIARALEVLRTKLALRGVASTGAALSAALAANTVGAVPAGLAAGVTAAAFAGAGGAVGAATAAGAAITFMNAKILLGAAALALIAFFVGSAVAIGGRAAEVAALAARSEQDAGLIARLRGENGKLGERVSALDAEVTRLAAKSAEVAVSAQSVAKPVAGRSVTLGMADWQMQTSILNNLQQIDAARQQYAKDKGRNAGSVADFVGDASPDPYIKAIQSVNGEDYSGLSMDPSAPLVVTMANGSAVTFDPAGAATTKVEMPAEERARRRVIEARFKEITDRTEALQKELMPALQAAIGAYTQANNGTGPGNASDIAKHLSGEDRTRFWELGALMGELQTLDR